MDNQSVDTVDIADENLWKFCGKRLPKAEVEYICQILLIYIIVLASLGNIALGSNVEIFTSLLSLCLGAILPSPQFRKRLSTDNDNLLN